MANAISQNTSGEHIQMGMLAFFHIPFSQNRSLLASAITVTPRSTGMP